MRVFAMNSVKKIGLRNMACVFFNLVLFCGCVTQSATQIHKPLGSVEHRTVCIEECVNRTEYKGKHDLAAEATRALTEKVRESGIFEVSPDAELVLTCDIVRFAEGSALKRWIMPGWGATQAEVVVMVWKKAGQKVLATFRSEASVGSGGLYTVAADQYIFAAAFDDILKNLKAWASGAAPEKFEEKIK
jgi:hypothetical protein